MHGWTRWMRNRLSLFKALREALGQIEDLSLEAITPTVATTGHAGKVEELSGQLMRMMLEMQREQRQWMKTQQEKQQKWMEMMQEKRREDTCAVDSKPKLPRPMLQKLTADDDIVICRCSNGLPHSRIGQRISEQPS